MSSDEEGGAPATAAPEAEDAPDGPLFPLPAGSAAQSAGAADAFEEHAQRFAATCEAARRACDRARAEGDSEAARVQGEHVVLELRRSARALHAGLRDGAGRTDAARVQVDGVAVQLHELAYEKGHLERDIAFERRFGSAHEKIVLPSAEDMRASGGSNASSTAAADGEHQLMLELLAYELALREKLSGEAAAMTERKAALQSDVATKRKFLDDTMPSHLSALCAAAKPLESFRPAAAAAPLGGVAANADGAGDSLPAPLFTLVSQFEAHRDDFEPSLTVGVVGDASAVPAPPAKQRRTAQGDTAQACQPFPLSVEVSLADSARGSLSLRFSYLPELSLITADGEWKPKRGRACSGEELLGKLYEGDSGTELPNPCAPNAPTRRPRPLVLSQRTLLKVCDGAFAQRKRANSGERDVARDDCRAAIPLGAVAWRALRPDAQRRRTRGHIGARQPLDSAQAGPLSDVVLNLLVCIGRPRG